MGKQVAWITGGGTGIGRALALEMSKRGFQVVICGRREDRLQEVVSASKKNKGSIEYLVGDVSIKSQVERMAHDIAQKHGRIDLCIANAGFSVSGKFERLSEDEWRRQIDINLFGVVWTLQAAVPYLKKTKGRIGVVSSVAGRLGVAKFTPYCSSKFALVGLCNSLHLELAASGVSVTSIFPGFVDTEISNVGNDGRYDRTRRYELSKWAWPADRAARSMLSALEKRKREVAITGHGKFGVFLGQYFPGITYWLMIKFSRKMQAALEYQSNNLEISGKKQ